jgi:hypothetical protein
VGPRLDNEHRERVAIAFLIVAIVSSPAAWVRYDDRLHMTSLPVPLGAGQSLDQ